MLLANFLSSSWPFFEKVDQHPPLTEPDSVNRICLWTVGIFRWLDFSSGDRTVWRSTIFLHAEKMTVRHVLDGDILAESYSVLICRPPTFEGIVVC